MFWLEFGSVGPKCVLTENVRRKLSARYHLIFDCDVTEGLRDLHTNTKEVSPSSERLRSCFSPPLVVENPRRVRCRRISVSSKQLHLSALSLEEIEGRKLDEMLIVYEILSTSRKRLKSE